MIKVGDQVCEKQDANSKGTVRHIDASVAVILMGDGMNKLIPKRLLEEDYEKV